MRKRLIAVVGGVVAAVLAGAGIAWTSGNDEKALSGQAKDRAAGAALRQTGGGKVTESDVGDDGAAYTVEVRLANGTQVEVRLDKGFNVVGTERDDDGSADQQSEGD